MLLVAGLAFAAGCDDDPTSPVPTDASSGEVTGLVRAATGQPVAGALVGIGETTATTGQDGRYHLTDLPTGEITIHVSAAGFASFELRTKIPDFPVTRDVSLERLDLFEFGDYALYAPAGAPTVRAVIVALGGPDTRAFVTGGTFGAPVPAVEAALTNFGERLRALAQTDELAVLGTSLAAMDDTPASDAALLDALREAAAVSGRPELAAAPLLFYGMSGGGPEATGFMARNPERVAGLFLKVPAAIDPSTGATAPGVPTYVVQAELDAFVDNAAVDAAFATIRQAGGLWAKVLERGVPHHSFSAAQRTFTIDWMRTVLELRLGGSPSSPLRPIDTSTGWLGEPVSAEISAWRDYPHDPAAASWLPAESVAEQWQSLGAVRGPSGATLVLHRGALTMSVGRLGEVPLGVFDAEGLKIDHPVITVTSNAVDVARPLNDAEYCGSDPGCSLPVFWAVSPGVATVTVEYEGMTDEVEVTVVAPVGSLVIAPVEVTLRVGESTVLTAQWLDDAGEVIELEAPVFWEVHSASGTEWGVELITLYPVPGTNGWQQKVTAIAPTMILLRPVVGGPIGPDPSAFTTALITIVR